MARAPVQEKILLSLDASIWSLSLQTRSESKWSVQRVNGRVAMWAFLICSLQELFGGQSVTQQAIAHPISASFLGIILSIASVAPKYVSGVALNELHDAASRDGLPPALRFFNKTHEIWLGRVAMLG